MPRKNKILIRNGTTTPSAEDFDVAEPAFDKSAGKLYIKTAAGTMVDVAGSPTVADGSITTAKLADPFVYDCGSYSAVVASAPTALVGTAGNAQVALTWGAPVYPGGAAITDYSIQYSSNGGTSWTSFSRTASTALSATVTGLTNSTAYIFRVAAITSVGTGAYVTSSSVTPVAVAATFTSFNSTWTAIGFTGSGTAGSPYTKANYGNNIVPAQATVVSSGTVRITGSLYSDYGIDIYKNGSVAYTISDNYGGNGGNYTINATISVAANDVIRFGLASYDYYSIPATALNIWWQ